jgi:hypothetical protein
VEHDRAVRRERQIMNFLGPIYTVLHHIPPRWPTAHDELMGPTNWVGVGPVVAQFWHDLLDGAISATFRRRDGYDFRSIFYGALDGLAWRFFDDEYVPTLSDVRRRKAAGLRRAYRKRRIETIEASRRAIADIKSRHDAR